MGREGVDARTSGTFYKAFVEATLLFGLDTKVMTPWIGRNLKVFHHRVAHSLTGIKL